MICSMCDRAPPNRFSIGSKDIHCQQRDSALYFSLVSKLDEAKQSIPCMLSKYYGSTNVNSSPLGYRQKVRLPNYPPKLRHATFFFLF